ncbi:MAG: hybrid sensor histidine kinase/response regulator [Bacteroidales bacterium]|nr:hybrid sensor histidine kinase/response regulator [Bacteroidales bacterium]
MEITHSRKYKVLVVDDNSENIRIIGSILRQNDYQVGFATRGQQALDILGEKGEDYDLILLDVNMPGLNGFEVCKMIREKSRLKDLPVIYLTANGEPEHVMEGFSSGGQDYVTKPFHSGELLARIGTHLELKESREQLKQMNAILEEKVKERTMELQEANKKLGAANRQLEQLDEAKAGFLRLISHEINTPLNGIVGFTEILKDLLTDTEYFGFIENLSESANRLKEFAQASLVITGLRTSPENYKKGLIDIGEITEEVITRQTAVVKQKKIPVHFQCDTDNRTLEGNADLLKICLTNLLKNALAHTPGGQAISIRITDKDSRLLVLVEDNGPGFSAEALRTLFNPFSSSDVHHDSNKGLGLFLVKMIADFHQAEISVSNRKSKGAKVALAFSQVNLSN